MIWIYWIFSQKVYVNQYIYLLQINDGILKFNNVMMLLKRSSFIEWVSLQKGGFNKYPSMKMSSMKSFVIISYVHIHVWAVYGVSRQDKTGGSFLILKFASCFVWDFQWHRANDQTRLWLMRRGSDGVIVTCICFFLPPSLSHPHIVNSIET